MNIKILQKGFNYSQDGPGNRLVYHLQGCNLNCPWCSNPEGIPINGCLLQTKQIISENICPFGAINNNNLNRTICTHCISHDCTLMYNSGLKWSAKEISLNDILDEIHRSAMMFFDGGGVTFTGGEATVQFEALRELLSALNADNIHTAIETNGTNPRLPELFPLIDWLIMDFKHYNPQKHQEVLGLSNANILQNLQSASKERNQLLIRIPLINGFNANEEDALQFAKLLTPFMREGVTLELLRYHEYGKDKWSQCGRNYQMKNGFVSDAQLHNFAAVLKQYQIPLVQT